jgi:hypothetical protein
METLESESEARRSSDDVSQTHGVGDEADPPEGQGVRATMNKATNAMIQY